MEAFFGQSLHLDMQRWKGKQLSMFTDFEPMRNLHAVRNKSSLLFGHGDVIRLVLIYNNTWLYPDNSKEPIDVCEEPCYHTAHNSQKVLNQAMRDGRLQLPNMVFFYNSGDYSSCPVASPLTPDPCTVPMITHIKMWNERAGHNQTDILVPQMETVTNHLWDFPWEKKDPVAFFRGTPYCSDHGFKTCSRVYLAYKCRFQPVTQSVQIGLMEDYGVDPSDRGMDQLVKEHGVYGKYGPMPIEEHMRFRWLVSLDGVSASYRFGLLLHTNSVVLKARSHWIEWFYRAIQPGRHYLEFFKSSKDDIFDLVPKLNDEYLADSAKFWGIAREAQQFAALYMSEHARLEYWRAALLAYRSLVTDMDAYVEHVVQQLRVEGKLQKLLGGVPPH